MPEECCQRTVPTLIRGRLRIAQGPDEPGIYRGAQPASTAALREELLAGSRQPELMLRFLAEMDRKLDTVLALLQSDTLPLQFPEEGHIVEISDQGLMFECNADLAEGNHVELLILLEEYPIRIVSALARVELIRPARLLPEMHRIACAMRYTSIAEADREAIIGFMFSEERKLIRQRKGEL